MKCISDTSEQCLLVDMVKCKKKEWERVSSKVSVSLCLGSASSFWQEYQSVCAGGLTLPSPQPSKTNRAMPMTQPCTWTPRLPTIAQNSHRLWKFRNHVHSQQPPQTESHPLLCECIRAMPFLHNCRLVATAWCNFSRSSPTGSLPLPRHWVQSLKR